MKISRIHCLRLLGLSVGLMLAACGCGSRVGGDITLDSMEQNQALTQSFPHAYVAPIRGGEYDVILVDNATDWDFKAAKKKRALEPLALEPIRQLMHIHLYWRPLAGTTRNPAATNASIDWYVLGRDGEDDVVVYQGAGYVSVRGSGDERTIMILDGQIAPKAGRGKLHDPIGKAKISGRVVARMNDARVRETLAEVEKQAGVAQKTGPSMSMDVRR